MGTPLSDTGMIADGYQQFLHVDAAARTVYVVEQGGFAGTFKVYGHFFEHKTCSRISL